jgi:hypothetical protein
MRGLSRSGGTLWWCMHDCLDDTHKILSRISLDTLHLGRIKKNRSTRVHDMMVSYYDTIS